MIVRRLRKGQKVCQSTLSEQWGQTMTLELADTPSIIIGSEFIIISEIMEILDGIGRGCEEGHNGLVPIQIQAECQERLLKSSTVGCASHATFHCSQVFLIEELGIALFGNLNSLAGVLMHNLRGQ